MPTVVEHRQKATVEAAQWSDRKDEMQHPESRSAESANQHRLDGGFGMEDEAYATEQNQIEPNTDGQGRVVDLFLPAPADRTVPDTHGEERCNSAGSFSIKTTGRRAHQAESSSVGSAIASTSHVRRCRRR